MAYNDLVVFRLLLNSPDKSFTVCEIAKGSRISKVGAYWIIKGLLLQDFIKQTNNRPVTYKVNEELFLSILKKR